MDFNKKDKLDQFIDKRLSDFKSELRTAPDPYLWVKLQSRLKEEKEGERVKFVKPSIFKIAYATIAATAALMAGIWAGSSYINSQAQDAELYRQEISINTGNFSGLSSELLNYAESDNIIDNENNGE